MLNIPLIVGTTSAVTKRSDKYLKEQQEAASAAHSKDAKKKHKKTKKSKKSKNKVAYNSSSESDAGKRCGSTPQNHQKRQMNKIYLLEPKPLHIVNTTLDMPEGVTLSDSEDKDGKYDPNDPHRALDIELDM